LRLMIHGCSTGVRPAAMQAPPGACAKPWSGSAWRKAQTRKSGTRLQMQFQLMNWNCRCTAVNGSLYLAMSEQEQKGYFGAGRESCAEARVAREKTDSSTRPAAVPSMWSDGGANE